MRNQHQDYTELQDLLRTSEVPEVELGESFLHDLHSKILVQESSRWSQWHERINQFWAWMSTPQYALAGAACLVMAFVGGFLLGGQSPLEVTELLKPETILVEVESTVDMTGAIPSFYSAPLEF